MTTSTATAYTANFELHTSKLKDDDACLNWLKSRYTHSDYNSNKNISSQKKNIINENSENFLVRLENDLAACASHRWGTFSSESPVYKAVSPMRDSGNIKSTEVRIQNNNNNDCNKNENNFSVIIEDYHKITNSYESRIDSMKLEPSRHIFTEVLRKKNQERINKEIEIASNSRNDNNISSKRPFFGGYILPSTISGPTRFLVFPQWMHDYTSNSIKLQELPYFLRGTINRKSIAFKNSNNKKEQIKEIGIFQRLMKEIIFSISISRKFTALTPRCSLFEWIDVIQTEIYFNNQSTERSFFSNSKKIIKTDNEEEKGDSIRDKKSNSLSTVHFSDSGVRTSFFHHNPRHSIIFDTSYRLSRESSNSSSSEKAIASISIIGGYDSAIQRFSTKILNYFFPNATYHLKFTAGPAAEYVTDEPPLTLFGKFQTSSWVALPIFQRLLLRIRNQSALTQPVPNILSTKINNYNNNISSSSSETTHNLFWATQGPRWDSSLVRGFTDDYPAMHYAKRWYSLISAELVLGEPQRETSSASLKPPATMLYANACFTDSFTIPPRASVGLAFKGSPRRTSNIFNDIIPTSFECSFNWWVNFDKGRLSLISGLSPGKRAEEAVLRLSPVETFRHMRCGLTWKS